MSRRLKFIAAGLGLVVIIALAWMFLLNPLREDIATVSANIESEKTKLATALAELAQAETTQAEGKENQARLLELAKMVPFSEEIPSLMLQIQDLADQSGIDFCRSRPANPRRTRVSDNPSLARVRRHVLRHERLRVARRATGGRARQTACRQADRPAVVG